ncbi:dephospho-CoA kinase [Collinsella sp. An2]|uniref:dephospho-CoA kinase n=1 Tax=Collinsella sp. An2 TaxID=1965585 RepID=UPI000B37378D|nr:dephospho-CoA kinase [Collinsella sp. An2]OUP08062.1 dephospho-CoA kinase [Collinsella sp. An2]
MYAAFVIGNIASGKSTATRYLESRGAHRIDLDQWAKDLYVPGSDVVQEIAETFGYDVLDAEGGIQRRLLAERAFSTPESIASLNAIVHPRLKQRLSEILLPSLCCSVSLPDYGLLVIEVSVPRAFQDIFPLADAVLAITAPLEVRRERAIERGMDSDDFDARSACQPSEDELRSMATVVIDNTSADNSLFAQLDRWLETLPEADCGHVASMRNMDTDRLTHAVSAAPEPSQDTSLKGDVHG